MRPLVLEAEKSGVFDQRLTEQMDFMCAVWQQHFFDVYSLRPHPHTGQVLRVIDG
jgi:hypothetical protein